MIWRNGKHLTSMKLAVVRLPLAIVALVAAFFASSAHAASRAVTVGQSVTFSVTANGTMPFTYQWYKNGVAISGAVSATFNIPAVTLTDAANYSATVLNQAGSTTSDLATLTVDPLLVSPAIITQPSAQSVTVGQSVSFSVVASGSGPLGYQWKKNGINISGATAATFSLPTVSTGDAASYSVVVNNTAGSISSVAVSLTVNALPVAPSITSQPTSQSITAGQSVSFSVAATGSGTLSYQWKKNGTAIFSATSSIFTLSSATTADAGNYSVVVGNAVGSVTSASATLTVNAAPVGPSITSQPTSQSVTAGQSVSFSVAATGSGTLSYQWKKNGANIFGATSGTFTLISASSADAGTYSVVVTNSVSSVTSIAVNLAVSPAPVPPSITLQPKTQSVTVGQSVTFSIAATGTAPLTYQWKKDGWDLGVASSPSVTLASVTSADAGTYSVLVANSVGQVSSIQVSLTVNALPVPPVITAQPTAQSVTAGESASFSVAATGSGTLTYQWKKNGVNLVGATSPVLTVASTISADTGNYSVVVTNAVGSTTSVSVGLTVNPAPVAPTITLQPAAQSVTAGAAVSFSVSAAGSGTLSYQWRKNTVAIAGANSSTLTIASTTSADVGGYSVIVTNSVGSVTSAIVSLSVSAAPVAPSITLQPVATTAAAGESASFSVEATGSAPLAYQWKKAGGTIAGATSSTYTIPAVSSADAGQYSVTVSNLVGSVTSATALLTITAAPPPSGGVTPVAPPVVPPPPAPTPNPVSYFTSRYTAADVGPVTTSGSNTYNSTAQTISLTAAGNGIGSTSDSFYFASAPATGNFSIVTKLDAFTASKTDAVAGLMIRESTAADAPSASIVVTSSGTVKLVRRLSSSTTAKVKAARKVSLPIYLRLTRSNGVVSGDYSSNGVDWLTLGGAEMNLPDSVRMGLVSASSSTSATSVAQMSVPTITLGTLPTVVSGLQLLDVGTSGMMSTASLSGTTLSLSGLGQISSGATREGAAFLARHNTLECSITTRVLPVHLGIPPARAGLMMRETLLDNAPQATLALNAHGQVVFEYRATSGGFAFSQTSSDTARYLMLDRRSNIITAKVSDDGQTWRTIGTAKVMFRQDPWIGLTTISSWWTTAVTVDFSGFNVINH